MNLSQSTFWVSPTGSGKFAPPVMIRVSWWTSENGPAMPSPLGSSSCPSHTKYCESKLAEACKTWARQTTAHPVSFQTNIERPCLEDRQRFPQGMKNKQTLAVPASHDGFGPVSNTCHFAILAVDVVDIPPAGCHNRRQSINPRERESCA